MTAAQISAMAECILAGSVLIGAIAWTITQVNSSISRSAFRAARVAADENFKSAASSFQNSIAENGHKVEKVLEKEQKVFLLTVAMVGGSVVMFFIHLVTAPHKKLPPPAWKAAPACRRVTAPGAGRAR